MANKNTYTLSPSFSHSPSLPPSPQALFPVYIAPSPQNKSYTEFPYSCESYPVEGGTFQAGVGLAITGVVVAWAGVAEYGVAVVGFTLDGLAVTSLGSM